MRRLLAWPCHSDGHGQCIISRSESCLCPSLFSQQLIRSNDVGSKLCPSQSCGSFVVGLQWLSNFQRRENACSPSTGAVVYHPQLLTVQRKWWVSNRKFPQTKLFAFISIEPKVIEACGKNFTILLPIDHWFGEGKPSTVELEICCEAKLIFRRIEWFRLQTDAVLVVAVNNWLESCLWFFSVIYSFHENFFPNILF